MRIVRYQHAHAPHWGVLAGSIIHRLEGELGRPRIGGPLHELAAVTLLAPCEPDRVVSVGANYADRCRENDIVIPSEPALHDTFTMPGKGIVVGPDALVRLPPWETHCEYGAELGVVIGRDCSEVDRAEVAGFVLGYTCINNIWAKTRPRVPGATNIRVYDSFCPVGPWIETELQPSDLAVRLRLNGELRQDSRTSAMLFDVATLVSFLSRHMTLAAGDVVMTGTPGGVSPLAAADAVEVEIEGIGSLANRVAVDPAVRRRPLVRMLG